MIESIHLQLLLATFAGWVGRRQAAVINYLIEENRVLKEQLESGGKRLRFTDDQGRRLAAKGNQRGPGLKTLVHGPAGRVCETPSASRCSNSRRGISRAPMRIR